jgi:3',5'-cyclic AMP phosphodiesterase CpdA
MLTVPFDLILHVGDIAYDDGTLGQLESQFFDVYRALIESFPVFPVAGNHDYGTASGAPLRQAFELPENGAPDGTESWYSFDWGNVHFVGLDTERIGDQQAAWLDADLAGTDKPWKVVLGHRPPYSSGEHGSSSAFRGQFGPLIEKHHVQLVLAGHDHDYERSQPIAGATYIVTGGGGRGTRPVGSSGFTAFSEDVLHFVQIEIYESELFIHAIDGMGKEFDSARVTLTSS